jgi:hypothetical protein
MVPLLIRWLHSSGRIEYVIQHMSLVLYKITGVISKNKFSFLHSVEV